MLLAVVRRHGRSQRLVRTRYQDLCGHRETRGRKRCASLERLHGRSLFSWVERTPTPIRPYLRLIRLDKPIGTWLLYWPCAWSITMAASHLHASPTQTGGMLLLFGTGALVMRGAGCTINDLWDQRIDEKVERTKLRPLAAGEITQSKAIVFLGGQLLVGLGVLTQLNHFSIALGASSLALVVLYPLMKRVTYYPQVVLGLTFNWGALLGWSAMTGGLDMNVVLPLYLAGLSWTVFYDTIYAHQDKEDDLKVGVKSTALRFGQSTRPILSCMAIGTVTMLGLSGYANHQSAIFYAISCGGAGLHLLWQLRHVDFDSRPSCWKMFQSNSRLGWIVWTGIVADYLTTLT